MTIQCETCHGRFAKCLPCGKLYAIAHRKHNNIKNHMASHPTETEDDINHDLNDEVSHCESLQSNCDGGFDNLSLTPSSDLESNGIHSTTSSLFSEPYESDTSSALDIDLSIDNLCISPEELPKFDNPISNEYFRQDYHMYSKFGEVFGGLRGVSWRSRYQVNLYDASRLLTLKDSMLMFNITKLLKGNTEATNNTLFDVLHEVMERGSGDFNSENEHVRLPLDNASANKRCLNGKFGIFNNMPCPTVHNVGDHACMKIGDVIAHHFALGRTVEFTELAYPTEDPREYRLYEGIHGSEAMSDLLTQMKSTPKKHRKKYIMPGGRHGKTPFYDLM